MEIVTFDRAEEEIVKKIHRILDDETRRLSIIYASTVSESDIYACSFCYCTDDFLFNKS